LIFEYQLVILAVGTLLCFIVKEKKGVFFSSILLLFFFTSYYISPIIKSIDPSMHYRYWFWIANDLLCMITLAYFAIKDRVYIWQSIYGQLLILPIPIIEAIRYTDRHFFDLSYSTSFYVSFIPILNTLVIILAFIPFSSSFIRYLKNKKAEAEIEA